MKGRDWLLGIAVNVQVHQEVAEGGPQRPNANQVLRFRKKKKKLEKERTGFESLTLETPLTPIPSARGPLATLVAGSQWRCSFGRSKEERGESTGPQESL